MEKEKEAQWVPPVLRQSAENKNDSNNIRSVEDDKEKAKRLASMEAELEVEYDQQQAPTATAENKKTETPEGIDGNDGKIVHKQISRGVSKGTRETNEKWGAIAEELYALRSRDITVDRLKIKTLMKNTYKDEFAPLLEMCPNLDVILAHMKINRFRFLVQEVLWTSDMTDWSEEDCRRIGRSMATLLRMVQRGDMAVDAWRNNYPQLCGLFEVEAGFEAFMVVFADNHLRNNKFGLMFRVAVGAALSTIDAATDIYVISTYYQNADLVIQANALLAMMTTNMLTQILVVLVQYTRKSWMFKLREMVICLLFLRPAVDAYRVSTNYTDDGATTDCLTEMAYNKGIELATESIPGCVLQTYVWLVNPEQAGAFALGSIGISAMTTGFASAMIAFDLDIDVNRRRTQPKMYGK